MTRRPKKFLGICAGKLAQLLSLLAIQLPGLSPQPPTSRRALLRQAGALGAGAAGLAAAPPASFAGLLPPKQGIEKTKPADAELDDELLASKSVRDGIAALKQYRKSAISLQDQFAKDGNMNLIPVIRKEFDFSKLRDDLNVVTTVFDDQTQLTTDQRTRRCTPAPPPALTCRPIPPDCPAPDCPAPAPCASIIYDLTELENAARLKKGDPERTPKKIANVQKWFVKLDKARRPAPALPPALAPPRRLRRLAGPGASLAGFGASALSAHTRRAGRTLATCSSTFPPRR